MKMEDVVSTDAHMEGAGVAYKIHYSCISHKGFRRSMNQDNFICDGRYREDENSRMQGCMSAGSPSVFGVFDGMGGEERGEVASLIAARRASAFSVGQDIAADLAKYCIDSNEDICRYARDNGIAGMGTTAAMLVFSGEEVAVCNIGDSKVFHFADGKMGQVSQDHVAIAAYGRKPPLSQNLGIPPTELLIEPYIAQGQCRDGDVYLICSDGLTDMVSLDEICSMLAGKVFREIAPGLVDRALANGGKDNVTVIVCKVERKTGWLLNRR